MGARARPARLALADREGRPGAHRDAEDRSTRRSRALDGRRFEGARRRGKNLLFPTEDGELVLRVHLMSAGRLRYLAHGREGAEDADVPAALRGRRRARPDRGAARRSAPASGSSRPAQLDAELGHLGPDALGLDAAALGEILGRERRQLHPLLRDQRALAGIGRAHANEILLRARLSPFKALDGALATRRSSGSQRRSHEDLDARARAPRAGQGRRGGLPHPQPARRAVPACGTPLAPRRLRGAHDLLLPELPDGRPGAQGPAALAPAALTAGSVSPVHAATVAACRTA